MIETHTTANGDSMLIWQMTDLHLVRTIALHLRHMQECRAMMSTPADGIDPVLLYSMPKDIERLRREAAANFQRKHAVLLTYLLPALLRGLLDDKLINQINQVYGGHSGVLPNYGQTRSALPASDSSNVDSDDFDSEFDDDYDGR